MPSPAEHAAEVVIYTTGYCGYCYAAKRLLQQRGVHFREVPCDSRPDLRRWLVEASRQRTVPQIFINGESVGGYTELASLAGNGKLDQQLARAPTSPRDMPA